LQGQFDHFALTISKAETNLKIPHSLGFQPKDIIQTSLTGAGAITYNYATFTNQFIDITTTGACEVRFFGGTYDTENL
jgi:hypothetical protein